MILLRGFATHPDLPSLESVRKLRCGAIAKVAPIVPAAPLCRASDVDVTLPGTHPLDCGKVVLTFLLRNRTGSPCSFSGVPGTTMHFTDGSEVLLAGHYPSSAEVSRQSLILSP